MSGSEDCRPGGFRRRGRRHGASSTLSLRIPDFSSPAVAEYALAMIEAKTAKWTKVAAASCASVN